MYHHERSLVKQLSNKPFALVGVNSDPDREKLKEVLKEKNLTWRNFWEGEEGIDGPIATRWNVRGWPTIYVLDQDGVIRYKGVRGASLDRAIETLLAEMGHEVKIENEQPDRETIMRDLGIKPDKSNGGGEDD